MKATHAFAFISLQLSGKENLPPPLTPPPPPPPPMSLRFLSLPLPLPFFSLSLLIQAQKTNKQNSSPFLTPCTGSPLFHFLSCQPELPSYSLTCPISLFPSSPALPLAPAFRLQVLFFTLPLLLLIFQLRVPPPSPAASFIRCHQGSSARLRSLSPAELLFFFSL